MLALLSFPVLTFNQEEYNRIKQKVSTLLDKKSQAADSLLTALQDLQGSSAELEDRLNMLRQESH